MDLSALKKGVKLKKVKKSKIVDRSAPVLEKEEFDTEVNDNKVLDYNIEKWSDLLEPVSFKTRYCELTFQDGENFKAYYELMHEKKLPLTEELQTWVTDLTSRLEPGMKEMNAADLGVFVKTSSRSPKDAPAVQTRLNDLYKEYIQTMPDRTEISRVRCLMKAGHNCQQVFSAKQAMDLLLASERIYADMKLATKYPERWCENIVLREWKTIDFELEFRSVVKGGKMHALSQYTVFLYSDFVNKNADLIAEKVQSFFYEKVAPLLGEKYEGSVIDFGFADESLEQCYVIELNPYTVNTDACLFSWARDRERFENGPFEFRYCKKRRKSVRPQLEDRFAEKLDELNTAEEEEVAAAP